MAGRKKGRVWAASEVMAELDDLDRRIQATMSADVLLVPDLVGVPGDAR